MIWKIPVCWIRGAALAMVFLSLAACSEQPDLSSLAPLKASIAARQATVAQMKSSGLCAENSSGMLSRSASAQLSIEQRTVIEEENFDRERVFDAVAAAYSLSVAEIKSLFVEMQPAR